MQIRFGYRDVEFPGRELGQLRESQDLLGQALPLRRRLKADGYLLLRRLLARDAVLRARRAVLEYMRQRQALVPDTPVLEGVMPAGGRGVPMMGAKGIAHHSAVLSVLENAALFTLFETIFGEKALTYPFKWLRAVGNEGYTAAHYDFVYMGRGSHNLYTAWIPLGDLTIDQGTLAICSGSHDLEGFARIRDIYGRMDVDRDGIEGWFERDPLDIVERFGRAVARFGLSRGRCHYFWHAYDARIDDQLDRPISAQLRRPLSTRERTG